MSAAISFKTPNGEEMVVLSRQDYDALLKQAELAEDLEDVQAIQDFERRLAAGEEELIPAELVDRLIDGDNPVRVWREFRGLPAKDLAAAAGISAAYISEIETGKKEGSLAVLKAIAKVLRIELDDLVWSPR
ncbi:helix-turn-helix domain-containing protein [Pararhizobium sp.]|uniref:helix-turn-helix domain-containing protein n=1 Tax=Pararhizobium sp. TaxID=1977563 RepID=UPI00272653E0|nr:helix-turn-helix transcriptional regulator [Pararhizobium sp.]MDO9414857.1 helix-turn-helix transcriptional regulator [Pararhizobium sp.]